MIQIRWSNYLRNRFGAEHPVLVCCSLKISWDIRQTSWPHSPSSAGETCGGFGGHIAPVGAYGLRNQPECHTPAAVLGVCATQGPVTSHGADSSSIQVLENFLELWKWRKNGTFVWKYMDACKKGCPFKREKKIPIRGSNNMTTILTFMKSQTFPRNEKKEKETKSASIVCGFILTVSRA